MEPDILEFYQKEKNVFFVFFKTQEMTDASL